jgi:hypothetical protein
MLVQPVALRTGATPADALRFAGVFDSSGSFDQSGSAVADEPDHGGGATPPRDLTLAGVALGPKGFAAELLPDAPVVGCAAVRRPSPADWN